MRICHELSLALKPVANPTLYPLAHSLRSFTGFLPVSLSLILLLSYASPFRSSYTFSLSIMLTSQNRYFYFSFSLSIWPPYSLVVFVTLTKVKAVLASSSCLRFTTNQRPTVNVNITRKSHMEELSMS